MGAFKSSNSWARKGKYSASLFLPGSLSVCGPSPWPSLRVKRSRMRKAEGFSPPLCPPPPFDRVAWDQEDTAHTRHTLYIYTAYSKGGYGSGRREKKPRQAAVVCLASVGGYSRGKCETKRFRFSKNYVLPFLYGILCPSRSSAGWLSFVLRIASANNVHAGTLESRSTAFYYRKRFAL